MQVGSKRQWVSLLCVVLGIALFGGSVSAQTVTRTYTYDFSGRMNIWDMSSTLNDEDLGLLDTGMGGEFTVTQDDKGKISGSGTVSYEGNYGGVSVSLDGTISISGSVTQSATGIARVSVILKMKGHATGSDGETQKTYHFTATASMKVTIAPVDAETSEMTGTLRVGVSLGGYRQSETLRMGNDPDDDMGPVELANTSFTLTFTAATTGKKVTIDDGELVVEGNGTPYAALGKGSFTVKSDVDSLTLKFYRDPEDLKHKAFTLTVKLDASDGTISKFSGKVLGQTLKGTGITASSVTTE